MMYENLSTNAQVLQVGQPLTRGQIDSLALMEDMFTNMRGMLGDPITDQVEMVLHAFMCRAMGECVCREQKELEV